MDYGSSSSEETDECFSSTNTISHGEKQRSPRPTGSQRLAVEEPKKVVEQQPPSADEMSLPKERDQLEMVPVRIPCPTLSFDNENGGISYDLSLFDKDYTIRNNDRRYDDNKEKKDVSSLELTSSSTLNNPAMTLLEEKLDKIYKSLAEEEDFSSHLKKQKDFTNPSIFPKVMDYFHIDGTASNLPKQIWDPTGSFKPFEFIEKLMASEERAARRRSAAQEDS